ncbi:MULTISPECIES: alkylphosphonate utilization protein [Phaeobacter]|uniref:Zn-ribbon-containing protein involved in phosphonate metabolism n=1 Tax=Phaeobacter piscinae TaxID=1580596 RepID=A0ABN5DGD1_9RHOB|nr:MULTISPECIES: alkylphosphonate utilization protein [Phaeobacter]ATG36331.1 putative Zn-ribbon-containing protein involved in phosphonate metabolism [Phaeobacter piscinae]ATG40271.1 putative Zn-ribbon-containing protein involved in phosphonate metabolism [Phaeobacter piscinae]AUQ86852.1 putative Zn-ribbon-containing protein involved in phosphonate metabolism [Phaeobacter piscinae]AUR24735.1 putative Zn-ribbon-containing protein involved in phosphonate metabolism [Phaeobacter piscinae]KII1495
MSCALCAAESPLVPYEVTGAPEGQSPEVALCHLCAEQVAGDLDPNHMRGLSSAMWSETPAVQVLAARLLARLADHDWARDLAEQLWLEDEIRTWVEAAPASSAHRDSNGAPLAQGDSVVLIKDLPVKGAGFTAKRGTAVRNISLVADNSEHIEGRVDGQRIVILTKFVKKK